MHHNVSPFRRIDTNLTKAWVKQEQLKDAEHQKKLLEMKEKHYEVEGPLSENELQKMVLDI